MMDDLDLSPADHVAEGSEVENEALLALSLIHI